VPGKKEEGKEEERGDKTGKREGQAYFRLPGTGMTGMAPAGSSSTLAPSLLHPMLTSASGSSAAIRLAPHGGRDLRTAPTLLGQLGRDDDTTKPPCCLPAAPTRRAHTDKGAAWWNVCAAARLQSTSETVRERRELIGGTIT